jgi:hypothetical protein
MAKALEQSIRRLAADRCEYCRAPEAATGLLHVIDHIIARQHGGKSDADNLALCCGRCNQFKGPNIAGIDPATGNLSRLFHPRRDNWEEHFRYDQEILIGLSPIGRATILVLAINMPIRIAARRALIESGLQF